MPVRQDPIIWKTHYGNKQVGLTQKEWDELDKRVALCDKWNIEVKKFCAELEEELTNIYGEKLQVSGRSFKSIYEHTTSQKIEPRNYLSFEVVEVKFSSKELSYYLGDHKDLTELKETITNDVYVSRTKSDREDGGSGENATSGDGRKPRQTRLERYAEKVCESLTIFQPEQRSTRGNSIREHLKGDC